MKQKTILLELLRWLCAGLAVVFLVVSFRQEPVSSAAFERADGQAPVRPESVRF